MHATGEVVEHAEGQASRLRPSDVIDIGDADATAGLDHSFPLAVVVELRSLAFALVTGAGVANRQVTVQILDAFAVPVFGIAAPGTQAANSTVLYSFAPLVTAYGSAGLGMMGGPLPGGKLPYNMSLSVQVAQGQAGDSILDGRLVVTQWPTR